MEVRAEQSSTEGVQKEMLFLGRGEGYRGTVCVGLSLSRQKKCASGFTHSPLGLSASEISETCLRGQLGVKREHSGSGRLLLRAQPTLRCIGEERYKGLNKYRHA